MKRWIFWILAAAMGYFCHDGARAQTKPTQPPLAVLAIPATTTPCLWVSALTSAGGTSILCLPTDASIVIDVANKVIRTTAAAPTLRMAGDVFAASGATVTLSFVPLGAVAVTRSGIHLASPADYTISGQIITFVSQPWWADGDVVTCTYLTAAK